MATTKKRKSPLKGRTHKTYGAVKKHKRRVNGVNPAVVSGTRKRRAKRKVSGITGSPLMDLALGVIAGVAIDVVYDKMVPISDSKAKKGLELAIGVAALVLGDKQKKPILIGVGASLTAMGGKGLAKEFGVIGAFEDFMSGIGLTSGQDDVMLIEMNGISQQNIMQGLNQQMPVISGGVADIMGNDMPRVVS